MIELSRKQSDAWHYLEDSETTEVLYGGGAGGGKSYLGCLWHISRRLRYAGSRGLIGRAELKAIKESTLITYLKVCQLMGYKAGVDYKFNGQDMIVDWSNGSRTIFKDLSYKPSDPNFESLGSTEFTDAFIDEAGEIHEKAFDIVNSRIRWMLHDYNLVPKILLSCNPNHNWIKFKYIKTQEGLFVLLKPYQQYVRALVTDNPDKGFVDLYKQQLERMSSDYDRDRLLHGDWDAIPRTGGEFWKQFNREVHVVKGREFNQDLAVHLSFDENVNPYLTCLVWQIESFGSYKVIRQIDEICLPDPHNRVKYVCNEFMRRYPSSIVQKLFIYGDATSQKEDTKKEKGENFFTDILRHLDDYKPVKRVPISNPPVLRSAEFVNEIFANNIHGLAIEINENCLKSIHDYCYAKEDSDGGINKKRVTDPATKISYEEYGHCFVGETMIKTINGDVRIDCIKKGDYVLTRKGYKRVINVFKNGEKEVKEYTFGDFKLKCTENHKVFVDNNFTSIGAIHSGIFCTFDKQKKEVCYQYLSSTTGRFLPNILNQKIGQKGYIILDGLGKLKKGFIDIFMNAKLAPLKKGCTFITRTVIQKITIFQTWKKRQLSNTLKTTIEKEVLNLKRNFCQLSLIRQSQKLVNGMVQRMEGLGIGNMLRKVFFSTLLKLNHALTVVLNLVSLQKYKNIAQENAKINTKQEGIEQRELVYDIEVEGEHEYFANGILVHNCSDSMRYIIIEAFNVEYSNFCNKGKDFKPVINKRFERVQNY